MRIKALMRRLWSLRYLMLISACVCAASAAVMASLIPSQYIATADIQLNTRVEGSAGLYAVGSRQIDSYVKTQAAVVKDIQVTGKIVDDLGWTQSYALAQQYNRSVGNSGLDFRTWLANRVADRIVLNFQEDTPVFSVGYVGLSSQEAVTMAQLVRDAYIDYSGQSRRSEAGQSEAWIDERLAGLRSRIQLLEKRNRDFGQKNDIYLNVDGISNVELKLREVSSYPILPSDQKEPVTARTTPPAKRELTEIDAEIARLSITLGPNHPQIRDLEEKRRELALVAVTENTVAINEQSSLAVANSIRQRLEQELLAKATEIRTAKRYASELDVLERQFSELTQKRQNFALDSATLRPIAQSGGAVSSTNEVYYPKRTFAVAGAAGFGAIFAGLLGLLFSLLNLRVTSTTDLASLDLLVLGRSKDSNRLTPKGRLRRLLNREQLGAVTH